MTELWDDNCGQWVDLWLWLMGVVNRWQVWLVGEIYGCGYQDVGVISGNCCKEVYIIIIILILLP